MPRVDKHALGQFIRTNCLRQLALNLYPDNAAFQAARQAANMPYPQSPRPGLHQIRRAGDDWQEEKLDDLTQTFGVSAIIGNPQTTPSNRTRYRAMPLGQKLGNANPISFFVESEFNVGQAFQSALGIQGYVSQFNLQYTKLRPDIIVLLSPGTFQRFIDPDGTVHSLPPNDTRKQLRIIDIKMTAEASPGYFAEVAYYSMVLAGWLIDQGFDSDFVVVPEAALWPGSHDASSLLRTSRQLVSQGYTPTLDQLWDAMQQDLELVPFEVFALRIRRFLQVDVSQALGQPWQALEWHVDNRCSFCEYLGEPRPVNPNNPKAAPHPDHCLPTAENQDHVSRVAFISQGARLTLAQAGITQVAALATRQPGDPVFDLHQNLRATRTVVAGRALSLQTNQPAIPPQAGTSACMPRWTDLHVYLSVDFDMSSAITVAFGLKAFWVEPRAYQSPLTSQRQTHSWPTQGIARVSIVIDRDINTERLELLSFLREIHNVLSWCEQQDQQNIANPVVSGLSRQQQQDYRTKVQFYLWDTLQYEHFTRIIGRHLDAILADTTIDYLAWLFPPEELVPNPEHVTRRSPITIVRDVVRGLLAAPVAHYYSLIDLARRYHTLNLPPAVAAFNLHPLFSTPLSDQIPSERAHEIWGRVTAPRHWQQQMQTYNETVCKRLNALETVTGRLESDLRPSLSHAAPRIQIRSPQRANRVSNDGQLWYAFSCLNAALEGMEVYQARAMPPHEREARFLSARLPNRLRGTAEQTALAHLGLTTSPDRRVYGLGIDSRDVKAKVGDFSFALSPEANSGILDRKISGVLRGTSLGNQLEAQIGHQYWRTLMEKLLSVTVVGLDRNQGIIAFDASSMFPGILDSLENAGVVALDQDVILDRVHKDFFTRKLLPALQAIGNPPIAHSNPNPLVCRAAGLRGRGARRTAHTPCADYLWNARVMCNAAITRNLASVRADLGTLLQSQGRALNPTQWQAWEDALTHRAWLVWGPPGTGKSTTVRAIIDGAVLEAHRNAKPLRVLLTAFTYTAIDNVLSDVAQDVSALLPGVCDVFRVRSGFQAAPSNLGTAIDLELNRRNPSAAVLSLRSRLQNPASVFVVGATPEQVHNLLTCCDDSPQAEWFDLIVIDEASQMDVSHAILPICGVADHGAVILAGDPLQLPPIHKAEPPKDLEDLVGSVYAFWREIHRVQESALGLNYRSNNTIVEFARESGYQSTLTSQSPQLSIDLLSPIPTTQPNNWPSNLFWSVEWARILAPSQAAVCFVYDDGRSSQRNEFEADAVASLLFLLQGRVSNQLVDEVDPASNSPISRGITPYSLLEFWSKAVGVVTPHRAQQGLIATRIIQIFNATGQLADAIREAVDTVERFQGQQRDIIIASYTLGDPDQIAQEEEFLMSLNRFNVIASRARAKLVVLVSQEVIGHLARDASILRESRLLKVYAEIFCNSSQPMNLGYIENGVHRVVPGTYRWH